MSKLADYLTIKDAAAYVGVAPNTLRNWEARGEIPVHRNPINGYRLFKIKDLDRLVNQVKRSASRPKPRPK